MNTARFGVVRAAGQTRIRTKTTINHDRVTTSRGSELLLGKGCLLHQGQYLFAFFRTTKLGSQWRQEERTIVLFRFFFQEE